MEEKERDREAEIELLRAAIVRLKIVYGNSLDAIRAVRRAVDAGIEVRGLGGQLMMGDAIEKCRNVLKKAEAEYGPDNPSIMPVCPVCECSVVDHLVDRDQKGEPCDAWFRCGQCRYQWYSLALSACLLGYAKEAGNG